MSSNNDSIVICRCEEVTLEEIQKWIEAGYKEYDVLKRILRVGMGPCQGRGCRDIILKEISSQTGVPVAQLSPGTFRPLAKPVKLGVLAEEEQEAKARE
jgi:bacterioferritin-associated ferredoxin